MVGKRAQVQRDYLGLACFLASLLAARLTLFLADPSKLPLAEYAKLKSWAAQIPRSDRKTSTPRTAVFDADQIM